MRTAQHGPILRGPFPVHDRLSTDFDGSTEYVHKASPSFGSDTSGALLLRFKLRATLTANGTVSFAGAGSTSGANNVLLLLGARRRDATAAGVTRLDITVRTTNGGTVHGIMGSTNLAAGTWYSVVVQSNGSSYSMYLNGVAETLNVWTGSNTGDWIGDLVHGASLRYTSGAGYQGGASTSHWNGHLDEVLYANRDLTSTEITEFHNSGKPKDWWLHSFAKDIRGAWHMGDGDDDSGLYDRSGSSNDMTLVNITTADYVVDTP